MCGGYNASGADEARAGDIDCGAARQVDQASLKSCPAARRFAPRSLRLLQIFCGGLTAAWALCGVQPAAAQDIDNVKTVDIAVQGRISQRCTMGASETTNLGDLTRPRISAAAQLQLDCNVP